MIKEIEEASPTGTTVPGTRAVVFFIGLYPHLSTSQIHLIVFYFHNPNSPHILSYLPYFLSSLLYYHKSVFGILFIFNCVSSQKKKMKARHL